MADDLDGSLVLYEPETGAILDANERSADLYGHSVERLRAASAGAFTPPSTEFTAEEAVRRIRAAADGDPQTFEWQIERANGERRWVRVHLNSTAVDGVRCVLSEVEDITEYRARERRLRLLSRIVRHNLRNKTNVLLGYANRIKTAVEDESVEREIETILEITTEVGTLSESVRQLEEIAEPDATERSPTNLGAVVRALTDGFDDEYPEAELVVEASVDVWVIADRGVCYAIDHAIENAVVHNDRDVPFVKVVVADDAANGYGIVRVVDDGPTIPEVETAVLDGNVAASSTYHGSGVGLWVMQWCVDSLGGTLRFEENDPRGNVVTVLLPRTEAAGSEE